MVFIFTVVEEANWLSLDSEADFLKGGFDAVICLGNSFAHLPDFEGDLRNQRYILYCAVLTYKNYKFLIFKYNTGLLLLILQAVLNQVVYC